MADHPGAPKRRCPPQWRGIVYALRTLVSHCQLSPPHVLQAVRQTASNSAHANRMLLICTVAGLPALDPAATPDGGSGCGYPMCRRSGTCSWCLRCVREGHSGMAAGSAPEAGAFSRPARGAADLGSVAGFVLEGELELGAVGDRPVLLQVDVLLDDLGHPQIAERPGGGLDRLGRRVFP